MKTAIYQDAEFEIHTFWYRQPVNLLQQWCYVIISHPLNHLNTFKFRTVTFSGDEPRQELPQNNMQPPQQLPL